MSRSGWLFTTAGENNAVPLWRPHCAYEAFPPKDLGDPKGTPGKAAGIHSYASKSFDHYFPALSGCLKDFKMDSKEL